MSIDVRVAISPRCAARGHHALLPIGHPGRAELGGEDHLDEVGLRLAADSRGVEPPSEQRRDGGAIQPVEFAVPQCDLVGGGLVGVVRLASGHANAGVRFASGPALSC